MKPYYQDRAVALYHGDCREVLPSLAFDVLVTDPPYPNARGRSRSVSNPRPNAVAGEGIFTESVAAAREVLAAAAAPTVLVFWTELEQPPVPLPLVAVHVWHRANVNGRPYEPIFHFAADGEKRRSEVLRHAVEFENATGADYLGHPTQKPVHLMTALLRKTEGMVCDPFAGVGSTLRAAKDIGRQAIGIEIEERYCEVIARRLSQEVLPFAAGGTP